VKSQHVADSFRATFSAQPFQVARFSFAVAYEINAGIFVVAFFKLSGNFNESHVNFQIACEIFLQV